MFDGFFVFASMFENEFCIGFASMLEWMLVSCLMFVGYFSVRARNMLNLKNTLLFTMGLNDVIVQRNSIVMISMITSVDIEI